MADLPINKYIINHTINSNPRAGGWGFARYGFQAVAHAVAMVHTVVAHGSLCMPTTKQIDVAIHFPGRRAWVAMATSVLRLVPWQGDTQCQGMVNHLGLGPNFPNTHVPNNSNMELCPTAWPRP